MIYTMLPTDVHLFADDTSLLYCKFLKDNNNKINFELKNIVRWISGNKISLNTGTGKTEIVHFRTNKAEIEKHKF